MARRSRAREVALQMLFALDQNRIAMNRKALTRFAKDRLLGDTDLVQFAIQLVDGVSSHKAGIDEILTAVAENWRLHRMMPADRNVLRLGVYELMHDPEKSPTAVVLNEAIELARRYGTADSAGFVNGILDKVAKTHRTTPAATADAAS